MEIIQQKRALEVIYDLFALRPGKTQYVKTGPQKIPFPGGFIQHSPLPRVAPEAVGMKSGDIKKLFEKLTSDEEVNLHTLMILRHGKIAAEITCKPYSPNIWHCTHSMCKTVTALAVGMLIDEGKLREEDRIVDFFPDVKTAPFQKYKNITVKDLLTMSSGVSFSEVGSVTDEDWTKGFFESSVKFEPGSEFAYNSMNSYLLSAIVTVITGQKLTEYLTPRLFVPLGITTYFWESSPTGINKGGWGMYLLPEDMAKIGQFILNRGKWRGKRFVSEEWILKISEKTFDSPHIMGKYGYGRHVWCAGRKGSVNCNGLFGQNVTVYPDLDVVVVTTAAIDSMFQTCRMTEILEEYFLFDGNFSDSEHPMDEENEKSLRDFCRESSEYKKVNDNVEKSGIIKRIFLKKEKEKVPTVPEFCRKLDGVEYSLKADNVSIIPLFCQLIQNNYDVGVETIGFSYNSLTDKFFITLKNNGKACTVPVGFGAAEYFDFNLNGEIFKLASIGVMTKNEDDVPTLKLRIPCLEVASERNIKIFFNKNGTITVKWSEIPGKKLIIDAVGEVVKPTLEKPIIGAIAAKTDSGYLLYRLDKAIEPTTTGNKV